MDTAEKLFEWAETHFKNIKMFYVTKAQINSTKTRLAERFSQSKRIIGTRSFHSFIPKDNKSIIVRKTSCSDKKKIVKVSF